MSTEAIDPRSADLDLRSSLEVATLLLEANERAVAVVGAALPAIAAAVDAVAARMREGGRLLYVGAGTSGRLAVLDAAECVPTFSTSPDLVRAILAGGDAALVHSVEGAEDDADGGRAAIAREAVGPADSVVGIAASGSTPFVLGALAAARARGALTAAISCVAPAPILDAADLPIPVPTGAEVLAGSTRLAAGTAQKLVLNMLSTGVMVRLGRVHGNRMIDVAVTNAKLRRRAIGIVGDLAAVDAAEAERLLDASGLEVRTAVAMGRLGVGADEARQRLAASGGSLRAALGEGRAER